MPEQDYYAEFTPGKGTFIGLPTRSMTKAEWDKVASRYPEKCKAALERGIYVVVEPEKPSRPLSVDSKKERTE